MSVAPLVLRLRYRDTHLIIRAGDDLSEPYTIEVTDLLGRPPSSAEAEAALEWLLVSISKLRERIYLRLGRKPKNG